MYEIDFQFSYFIIIIILGSLNESSNERLERSAWISYELDNLFENDCNRDRPRPDRDDPTMDPVIVNDPNDEEYQDYLKWLNEQKDTEKTIGGFEIASLITEKPQFNNIDCLSEDDPSGIQYKGRVRYGFK